MICPISWIKRLSGAIVILLIGAGIAPAASSPDLLRQAEQAWQHREDPYKTQTAIKAWEQVLEQSPNNSELYIRLTRACGRAYRNSVPSKEREYWANEARRYGELAVQKNPDRSEAYAEYGEALGQWAQAHKGVHSLGAVKMAMKNLNKAVALDPKNGFAHMLLAQFYEQSPSVISVGDKKKALEEAKLAVETRPDYAITRLTLAKIYLARGNKDDARKELETIVKMTPPKEFIPETKADQATARELLKNL
jgi:tetratricopeptide (TPR) repeat protein